jgi:membrane protease YdiL (CAAX protease family)
MFPGSPILAITAMFVSMGLLVPLAEEVFYRGVLHRAVSQKLAVVPTVLVISAGWALVHIGDYGLVPFDPQVLAGMLPSVFVMGLALGYCREVTSSVVGSTIAQGTANVLFTLWALWL